MRELLFAGGDAGGDELRILDAEVIEAGVFDGRGFLVVLIGGIEAAGGQFDFGKGVETFGDGIFVVAVASEIEGAAGSGFGFGVAMLLIVNVAQSVEPINLVAGHAGAAGGLFRLLQHGFRAIEVADHGIVPADVAEGELLGEKSLKSFGLLQRELEPLDGFVVVLELHGDVAQASGGIDFEVRIVLTAGERASGTVLCGGGGVIARGPSKVATRLRDIAQDRRLERTGLGFGVVERAPGFGVMLRNGVIEALNEFAADRGFGAGDLGWRVAGKKLKRIAGRAAQKKNVSLLHAEGQRPVSIAGFVLVVGRVDADEGVIEVAALRFVTNFPVNAFRRAKAGASAKQQKRRKKKAESGAA